MDAADRNDPTRTPDAIDLVVVGAHLDGQPLNHQLTDRGAQLVQSTRTAPSYRLFALATDPPKPGLVRVGLGDDGVAIEAEVWRLSAVAFAAFVDAVPAPMVIGRVVLEDGRDVAGFLCEPVALSDARDISSSGGWRAHLASG